MDHHPLRYHQKKFKTYGPNSLTNFNLNQTQNTFTGQSIFFLKTVYFLDCFMELFL
ncbi:hypothetical protein Gotur_009922 [Gossypium turneri]